MALTQMQIIQSLGDAMSWFERELAWGVKATEINHLVGRIGELYAALITNGQMADSTNQHGFDVISKEGDKISVKTTAIMGASGHVSFNINTLNLVDRVIILRINTDEMQIETLFNDEVDKARFLMSSSINGKSCISLSKLIKPQKSREEIPEARRVNYEEYQLVELANGTVEIWKSGVSLSPVKPILRSIANKIGVGILNGNGNPFNTRQLGSAVIRRLECKD